MAFFPLELVTMLILPARVLPTAFVENERGGTERQISKQKQEQEQEQEQEQYLTGRSSVIMVSSSRCPIDII